MTDYVTLDSGSRVQFETGAMRDGEDGKPRPDLIPILFRLKLAEYAMSIESDAPHTWFWLSIRDRDWLMAYSHFAVSDHAIRLGALLQRGAAKYTERNWQKGMPMSRAYRSLCRHYAQWEAGHEDEDHYAAVLFNLMALWYYDTQPQFEGNKVVRDLETIE